jgi:hypothetical protein
MIISWSMAFAGFVDVTSASGVANGEEKEGGLVLADLDSDGWLDLVVAAEAATRVHLHSGAGLVFDPAVVVPYPQEPLTRQLLVIDVNHDGWADLIRTSSQGADHLVGTGPTSFQSAFSFHNDFSDPLGYNAEGAVAADPDGDGLLDVFIEAGGRMAVWQNQGGALEPLPMPGGAFGFGAAAYGARDYMAVGDVDGDRLPDLIVRTDDGDNLFRYDGAAFQPESVPVDGYNEGKGGVAFCDLDNDGDLDVIDAGGTHWSVNDPVARWVENQGSAGWEVRPIAGGGLAASGDDAYGDFQFSHPAGSACADLDQDGDLDIALTWQGDDALLLLTNYGGSFGVGQIASVEGNGVAAGDLDRDGDLDLVVSEPYGMGVYRNDQGGRSLFIAPRAVVGGACDAPIRRVDWGSRVIVPEALTGDGVRELAAGEGRGGQAAPWLHAALGAGSPTSMTLWAARSQREALVQLPPLGAGSTWLAVDDDDLDGDGLLNVEEGQGDLDGDGFVNDSDLDSDGDGVDDRDEAPGVDRCAPALPDTDGDGLPDPHDDDDDDDGVLTAIEGRDDLDGDGLGNHVDVDADGDGTLDADEAPDVDGDGLAGWADMNDRDGPLGDLDGDGLGNDEERALGTEPSVADTDSDGLDDGDEVLRSTDPLAFDSDAGGVGDGAEVAGGTDPHDPTDDLDALVDSDGDGLPDPLELALGTDPAAADTDADGLRDDLELGDTDGDGVIDALSPDDDGDGVPTADELGRDTDGDRLADHRDDDDDGDGLPTATDPEPLVPASGSFPARDGDGDGLLDADELAAGTDPASADSDGDGLHDGRELASDTDGDGLIDGLDDDDDGDGLPTLAEGWADPDADGLPAYLDLDSDGDGLADAQEGLGDDDGDGVPNALDADDGGLRGLPTPLSCASAGGVAGGAGLPWAMLWLWGRRRR